MAAERYGGKEKDGSNKLQSFRFEFFHGIMGMIENNWCDLGPT
jgi:hypothetical protein